jgi:uncharacterized iron-regulated membrane protein
MKRARLQKVLRKWHRILGLFFGVQFLFWTLGGIYFSWTNLKHVKGEDIVSEPPPININSSFINPNTALEILKQNNKVENITHVQLVNILDSTYYQIKFHFNNKLSIASVNAITGNLKSVFSKDEAMAIAQKSIKGKTTIKTVQFLEQVSRSHEYRNKPLPAYAITLVGDVNTTVYISAQLGNVQVFRNTQWRIYDFFWMLHTMDFVGRSDFNNWVLRIFSVAGLFAILSGFAVFFTMRSKRKLLR